MARILFVHADADRPLVDRILLIAEGRGLEHDSLEIGDLDNKSYSKQRLVFEAADQVVAVWSPEYLKMQSAVNFAQRAADANKLVSLKTERLGEIALPLGLSRAPSMTELEVSEWEADGVQFLDTLFASEDLRQQSPDETFLGRVLEPCSGKPKSAVNCIAVSPDGRIVAAGGQWDDGVRLWDPNGGRILRSLEGPDKAVHTVAFSPDGKFIAAGGDDHVVRLWRVRNGQSAGRFEEHKMAIRCLAFTSNGKRLISGSEETLVGLFGKEKTLRLWDISDGQCLHDFRAYDKAPVQVVVLKKENLLVCGGVGLRFFDPDTGNMLQSVDAVGNAFAISASEHGQMIAFAGNEAEIKLWDMRRNQVVRTITGQSARVNSLAFSPSGRTLVSGGDDKTLALWLVSSGRLVRIFAGHHGAVNAAAFSPDGRTLYSASDDGSIGIWDLLDVET